MENLTEILKRVERLERKIREIERKPHYTTVGTIKKLTVFDTKEKLRRGRENGELRRIKKNGKFYYDLNFIHESLFKKQTA